MFLHSSLLVGSLNFQHLLPNPYTHTFPCPVFSFGYHYHYPPFTPLVPFQLHTHILNLQLSLILSTHWKFWPQPALLLHISLHPLITASDTYTINHHPNITPVIHSLQIFLPTSFPHHLGWLHPLSTNIIHHLWLSLLLHCTPHQFVTPYDQLHLCLHSMYHHLLLYLAQALAHSESVYLFYLITANHFFSSSLPKQTSSLPSSLFQWDDTIFIFHNAYHCTIPTPVCCITLYPMLDLSLYNFPSPWYPFFCCSNISSLPNDFKNPNQSLASFPPSIQCLDIPVFSLNWQFHVPIALILFPLPQLSPILTTLTLLCLLCYDTHILPLPWQSHVPITMEFLCAHGHDNPMSLWHWQSHSSVELNAHVFFVLAIPHLHWFLNPIFPLH